MADPARALGVPRADAPRAAPLLRNLLMGGLRLLAAWLAARRGVAGHPAARAARAALHGLPPPP
ncbi:MAG TPA: hypothetical protein VNL77_14800, partial [Roseiflexaceae bacterium]|nr:hypothetical protein [Roseiflexaceae bacterium]